MCNKHIDTEAERELTMAEYSIPKKDPYVVKVKCNNGSASTTLKETPERRKKAIRASAEKFACRNIRKGWK